MIVTEEEAKTKRCQEGFAAAAGISADGIPVMQPEASGPIVHSGAVGFYGVSRGGAPMNCLGSACMAWRWDDESSVRNSEPFGYCGKAGKP